MKHELGYFFKEGLSNMFTHGFMSFAAVGITVACLLIMGTFSLVALNAQNLLNELESENEILAYVDESLSEEEARALQKKLEKLDNVGEVTFISREEAMKAFQEKYEDDPLFQDLDAETFRHRYTIRTLDIEKTAETRAAVEAVEGIAKVNAYEEIAGGFIAVRNIAGVVCLALIVILFVVSMFIISNTIKLTTFDRRDEIAIMKMVGATDGFIRWPFVFEGLLFGLLSAAIAFALQWLLYSAVSQGVSGSDTIELLHIIDFKTIWLPVAGVFAAAGVFIGVCGSLSAIRKFLQV
ncbi:MAG: permease-like cell division protein FtsX [Oscillospiraceae bacterium]